MIPQRIAAVQTLVPPFEYELIVVDNGSKDGTVRVASELGAMVIRRTTGTIGALRNFAVRHTRGEILVFLDADIVLTPEWADRLPAALEAIRREPGMLTGSWCTVPANASWLERWWFAPRIKSTHLGTGHMIVTRQFFDELGGFDETLATGEDYDFSRRAVAVGGRLAIDEQLRAEHHGFPRTIGAFVRREAWHGMGDFSSLSVFIRSKVAIATATFVLLHGLFLVGLMLGSMAVVSSAPTGITAICLASSCWKYGHLPAYVILHNAVIFWFYYLGRAFAMVPWVARIDSNRAR